MNSPFTKALIRACKRKISGELVTFAEVIGQVAAMEPKYVTPEDVAEHLAGALFDVLQVESAARATLRLHVIASIRIGAGRALVIGQLAHTRVDDLRALGLWDD